MVTLVCYGRVYCNPDDRLYPQWIPISHASSLFLIGSFGASSVLIFGTPNVPYAQPRNLLGGHLISALIGVTIAQYVDLPIEFQAVLVVSLSILFMLVFNTVHPAGGATGLIAVMGHDGVDEMGFCNRYSQAC